MGTFQTGLTFKKGVLTNGAPLPGQDFVSALLFYGTAPTLFPSFGYKKCFSIQDAINAGVVNTHVGETKATGTYLVTNKGAIGDTVLVTVQEPINPTNQNASPNLITLCSYTQVAADIVSTTTSAARLAAEINLLTYVHGYTASPSTATVTITARPGLGVFLNSGTPIAVTISGTFAGTLTQFGVVPGVASVNDVWYYHVSEYFRINPNGVLYLAIYAVGTYDFSEVNTLQLAAGGAIRQIGVYAEARTVVSNSAADILALNTICNNLDIAKMPLSAILVENMKAVTDLTTLPNLSGYNSEWVSSSIGQDGAGQGFNLFKAYGITVGSVGAILGAISIGSVGECIGNPIPKFNLSNGFEHEVPALGNGTLFNAVSTGQQTQFDNYRYIYTGNFVGYTGTYFSDSHCAIIQNSNYGYIEQNRVQGKIERILYIAYLPYLKSELQLNADGTLYAPLVSALESVGDNALLQMVQAGELSGVETIINPLQNITNSGKLIVTLYEQNNPIARSIEIDTNSVSILP